VVDVLGRVTMQVFVGDPHAMIAAAVQCDVDGIPKGSHCLFVWSLCWNARRCLAIS
jgi:hypothetical protein